MNIWTLPETRPCFTLANLLERTENVTDVVNMGDVFDVKFIGFDLERKDKVSEALLQNLKVTKNAHHAMITEAVEEIIVDATIVVVTIATVAIEIEREINSF